MKEIAVFLVGLFEGLKFSQRWVAIILTIAVVSLGFWGFEHLTGYFALSKLEKQVALLSELQKVGLEIRQQPDLIPIYEKAVQDLYGFKTFQVSFPLIPNIDLGKPGVLGKAISGASFWFFIAIFGLSTETKKNGKLTGLTIAIVIALLFIAALFGWIGTLIPTIWNPWVNYIGFPILQVTVLVLLFRTGSKTK